MSCALEVDIRKRLEKFELHAKFEAKEHGLVAVFGRSGAGKSCVVNGIVGLLKPDAGRIVVNGETLFDSEAGIDVPIERRRVGYVFQDARLFPHLSVRDNLRYGWKRSKGDRPIRFDDIVDLLGIDALLDRRPIKLSGGEKQRVAIGRALLAQPRLLLMDEPLASLDQARKTEILPYIEKLRDELGIFIVYVSHALEEVYRLSNTLVLMNEGMVLAHGAPEELSQRLDLWPHLGRFEAGAVIKAQVAAHDDRTLLTHFEFQGGRLTVARVDLPLGRQVRVRLRARDVILATDVPHGLSVQNVLHGTVSQITEELSPYAEVKVTVGEAAVVSRITRDSVRRLNLRVGQPIYALAKSVAIDGYALTPAPGNAGGDEEVL